MKLPQLHPSVSVDGLILPIKRYDTGVHLTLHFDCGAQANLPTFMAFFGTPVP